jgi:BON domain
MVVKLRIRFLLTGALGLWLAHPVTADEPAQLSVKQSQILAPSQETSANQQVANAIADQLRQNGQLRHYNIHVVFQNGSAELTGSVTDQLQREEALRVVQGVPGVERVRDNLMVGNGVSLVQGSQPPAEVIAPPREGGLQEPLPIGPAPSGAMDLNPPLLPPYAWPTYAPYNNYSRVAYPNIYPYEAWPFIGPAYPFPKIPLGWRSVKLTWEDGHWWYSRHSNHYDWWKIRYW